MRRAVTIEIPPADDVVLSVVGHPEYDRTIRAPRYVSDAMLGEAFLLSVGIAKVPMQPDDDYDGHQRGPRSLTSSPLPSRGELIVPEFPHRIDRQLRSAPTPRIGDPVISIVSEPPAARAHGPWRGSTAELRIADINHELLRRFGVVIPKVGEAAKLRPDSGVRTGSRVGMLLESLTPLSRVAVLAHLDTSGLLVEASPDLATVEATTAPFSALIALIGADGITQDEKTGWISVRDQRAVASALEWAPAEGIIAPDQALIALARRSRLIRRFKGRVVVNRAGHALTEPHSRSLERVARIVLSATDRSREHIERYPETALTLLAIADGAATQLADVPDLLRIARVTLASNEPEYDKYGDWMADSWQRQADAEATAQADSQSVLDGLAVFSSAGAYGTVTPAMRAVARAALM